MARTPFCSQVLLGDFRGSASSRVLVLRRRRLHEPQQHPHLGDSLAVLLIQRSLEPHVFRLGTLTQRDDTPVNAIRMLGEDRTVDVPQLDRAE